MWGQSMMNTPEATLSVVFIAIFIIEHGDGAVGTKSPDLLLQDPRFIGVRKGQNISITCGCLSILPTNSSITWHREHVNGSFTGYLLENEHIKMESNTLIITRVQKKHSGVYFCNFTRNTSNRVSCGTELMVLGPKSQASAKTRNKMKDAIIMVQTILIVIFISVPVLLLKEMKKKHTLKIEDHTYEGLEAYQTATYEDIQTVRVIASKTMEGEHPCLE